MTWDQRLDPVQAPHKSLPGCGRPGVHCSCWMPPGPGLVLLLCWPQQPGQPSRVHPDPAMSHWHARLPAARRPAATGLPAIPFYPSARPGMTHRDEQGMRRRAKGAPRSPNPASVEAQTPDAGPGRGSAVTGGGRRWRSASGSAGIPPGGDLSRPARDAPARRGCRTRAPARARRTGRGRRRRGGRATGRSCRG